MFRKLTITTLILTIFAINFSFTRNVFAGDYYTGVHFDTAETGLGSPGDITAYNDFLWIVDSGFDEVYKYNPDGTYTGVSFDTAGSGANNPTGIVAYNDFFWITDPTDNEVYKYNPDGTYTTVSFDTTASGAADAVGITAYDDFLWIIDPVDDEVYKYNPDGTYTSVSFDIAGSGANNASGIVAYDDFFWIQEGPDAEVFKYNPDGTYTGVHFDNTSESNSFQGITTYNDFFWIWDSSGKEVYKYTTTEAIAPTVSSLSPIDGATSASTKANLVITFNEYVDSATGNVTIYKASDNSIVEAIDVEGGQVTGEDTTIITINPSTNLSQATEYYVQIDATAFDDLAGNSFAGISDTTTWNFTTSSAVHDGIERVSVDSDEIETDGESYFPYISSDGRYVVFYSAATNLISDDTNGQTDVFIRDTVLDTTSRISVSSSEEEGDNASYSPYISADGNFVTFVSDATNLVAGDINVSPDIFMRDIALGTTTRISVDSNEVEAEHADGDVQSMSSDNNLVVFSATATNLVAGDTNGSRDVFMRDIALGTTTRISVDSNEVEGDSHSTDPIISADGNYVVFYSQASNLVADDNNGVEDIFLRNIALGITTRISVSSDEVEGDSGSDDPSMSSDGNYIVFSSEASNLVADDTNGSADIFIRDIALGTTTRISVSDEDEEGDDASYLPFISLDGQYVGFLSDATNLVSNDTNAGGDVFLYDRENDTILRISVDDDGNEIFESSVNNRPVISEDNQYIAFDFSSEGSGLVEDDTNDSSDIFVVYFDRVEEEPEIEVSRSSSGSTRKVVRPQNIPIIYSPTNLPACLPGHLFNANSGEPCGSSNNISSPNIPEQNKFIFTKNLWAPMIDFEVKELQKYLNTHGYPVALTGAGSLGNETTKFGNLTISALKKFQASRGLTPDAIFGPMTRGVVNFSN